MNLYVVTYKRYGENQSISVVASSPAKVLSGALMVMRQRYHTGSEILTIIMQQKVDRVER